MFDAIIHFKDTPRKKRKKHQLIVEQRDQLERRMISHPRLLKLTPQNPIRHQDVAVRAENIHDVICVLRKHYARIVGIINIGILVGETNMNTQADADVI